MGQSMYVVAMVLMSSTISSGGDHVVLVVSSPNLSTLSPRTDIHLTTTPDATPAPTYTNNYDNDLDNMSSTPLSANTSAMTTKEGPLDVFRKLEYVLIPTLFVVGTVGNSLSVVIMMKREFRVLTSSIIIICLSLSDSAVLLMQPFQSKVLSDLFGRDVRSLSNLSCIVFSTLWRTAKSSSAWLIVFISIERLLAVYLPLHIKLICTRRNTKIIIGVIYASTLVFSIGWSLTSKVSKAGFCVFNYAGPEVNAATVQGMLIAGTIICGMLPTCILPLTTSVILCRLNQIRKKRRFLTSDQTARRRDETSKITAMLMSVPIAFIILVSPTWIGHNAGFILGENYLSSKRLAMWRQVARPLEQMNYSINVFLYITCNKMYRKRLAALFCPARKSVSNETILTVSTARF